MRNKVSRINVTILFAGIMIVLTFTACSRTNFFERKDTLMAKVNISNTIVNIVYVQSGATTKDIIQVYVEEKNGNRILKNIENNNFLLGYQYINDSTFSVIVNKIGVFENKPDTVVVSMK